MNAKPLMSVLAVIVFVMGLSLLGARPCGAVEEHHEPNSAENAPSVDDTQPPGMMQGPGMMKSSGMMDMMGRHGGMGGRGQKMMGMMGGAGDKCRRQMMGNMGGGMMQMMMSHMTAGPGGMDHMMGMMGGGMMHRSGGPAQMLENLNLTPEQWDRVHALARKHLERMIDLSATKKKLQLEMAGLRMDRELDPQQVKQLFSRIAEVKADMFLTGRDYMRGVKDILTEEQIKELESRKM
ncbi:MAG: hypothetical protein R6U50_09075 [Desulfobacterales bacterium]